MDHDAQAKFDAFIAEIFAEANARRAKIEARKPIFWRHRSGVVVDVARRRIARPYGPYAPRS